MSIPEDDFSIHYIPELTVAAGCVVSGGVVEPTTGAWEEIIRT